MLGLSEYARLFVHAVDKEKTSRKRAVTKYETTVRAIITNGVKGEMPSFKKKLGDADLAALVGFLRSLK
jgi:mono/diheme cytochrome c family protein